ncbi:M20/M25/M40 family metallo-hydrolase [Candidatus Litorirhabdus singularis]|nr:M20/M25/M40 family metallo-hydrolase [Candidatus Litorirhabdus singularis]
MLSKYLLLGLLLIAALPATLFASNGQAKDPGAEATEWLQAFLRVDTVNPPGNESRAVDFYAEIFDREGIVWESAESAPGRGNIWARIKGGDEPALILLQHTDVVPSNPEYWSVEPLSGLIRDGYLWGRGALDMKGTGISHLAAFLALHRAGKPLNRDVIFLATADEEAGGKFGVGWMVEHHPEVFAGAGLLLNEGGGGSRSGDQVVFGVEVTQKVPVWLRLTAEGTPGHGSSPRSTSAVDSLIGALTRLQGNPFPARIIAPVDAMFKSMALDAPAEQAAVFTDMRSAIKQPGYLQQLQSDSPRLHAITRDTCSITRLQGSSKINVIPPVAWAEIDCRILPDRPASAFIADINKLLEGRGILVTEILSFGSAISTTDTVLYRAIEEFANERYPGSRVMPAVLGGFTDSHFTRELGIASYGFSPVVNSERDYVGIHGNDERINIADFREGVDNLIYLLGKVVYP